MNQCTGSTPNPVPGGAGAPARPKEKDRSGLRKLGNVLTQAAGAFGPLKAVVDEITEIVETPETTNEAIREHKNLREDLETLLEDLSECFSGITHPTMTLSAESLCNLIREELNHLKQKLFSPVTHGPAEARRHYREGDYPDVSVCYQRIQNHFQRLMLNMNTTLWKINDEQAADAKLKNMSPAMSACYNSAQSTGLKRGPCTESTRLDVLDKMNRWIYASPDGAVYWLSGMAGTGKTTIAYSLCAGLDLARKLGANFFCSRLLPECRDVAQIIPSIAYQLARFSRPFRYALLPSLEKDPEIHTRVLQIQFDALIVQPLMEVRNTLPTDLIVIIDALDECDDQGSAGQILDLLLNSSPAGLPIKFFVSSRPEPQIRDQIIVEDQVRASARLVLHELDQNAVRADIETFLRVALKPMKPSEFQIRELGKRAGILFIYASTAVRYIGYDNFRRNPRSRLEAVIGISHQPRAKKDNEIDTLYLSILDSAFRDPNLDDIDKEDMKQVLHTIISAREPLIVDALSALLKFYDVERVQAALRPLWSVLHIMETSGLVTTLHASFPEFLSNADRSREYWCDTVAQEGFLANTCFDYIGAFTPKFNVCQLESSYLFDNQIPDFDTRVSKSIPIPMSYACRYWGVHLEAAQKSNDLIKKLDNFLSTRFLLWMEILNLKRSIMIGTNMLRLVQQLAILGNYPTELLELLEDGLQFIGTYALSAVAQSTPHLYISMLQFWPRSLPIAKRYEKYMRRMSYANGEIMGQLDTTISTWTVGEGVVKLALAPDGTSVAMAISNEVRVLNTLTGRFSFPSMSLQGHTKSITSLAFSPDGSHIISGSADSTLCLWAFQSRKLVHLLSGHNDSVTCVIFSPQGDFIFSGSNDRTIRTWDVQTGRGISGPLEGHGNSVVSLAHSLSGSSLASGSNDQTIRIWDSRTGRLMLEPLRGHDGPVVSIAFSPDGSRIVSGSWDRTVRIWNAQNGQLIFGPLKGHTFWVLSVAFSPDSTCIVSGSNDNTIRLWNARDGTPLRNPLKGHTQPVTSVGFLPGGTRIYSVSRDATIRIWYIQRAKTKFVGPTNSVLSVAFSPDGNQIASGSEDSLVYIWDAVCGELIHIPLQVHTGPVQSVRFSSDSTQIVSGSLDKTVCLIDVQTGGVLRRLQHDSPVRSVDFSPDNGWLASGSGDGTIVWDLSSGKILLTMGAEGAGGKGKDQGLEYVATALTEYPRVFWKNESTSLSSLALADQSESPSVRFSSDGTFITSRSKSCVKVWRFPTGSSAFITYEVLEKCAVSENRKTSASSVTNENISLMQILSIQSDLTFGGTCFRLVLDPNPDSDPAIGSGLYSDPDLQSAFDSKSIFDSDSDSDSDSDYCKKNRPSCFDSSLEGDMIISGYADGSVRIYDVKSENSEPLGIFNDHARPVTSVHLSPNGHQISSCEAGDICLRDIRGGYSRQDRLWLNGHSGTVTALDFSPAGTRLVSGSKDKTIRVWNIQSLQCEQNNSTRPAIFQWHVRDDGWVVHNQSMLLFWAPPRLCEHLQRKEHQTLLIASNYSYSINFDDGRVGESWTECFRPG